MMTRHVEDMVDFYGEGAAMRIARKIIHDYLKGRGFHGEARAQASELCTLAEFFAFRDRLFSLHSGDHYWAQLERNPQQERRLRPGD